MEGCTREYGWPGIGDMAINSTEQSPSNEARLVPMKPLGMAEILKILPVKADPCTCSHIHIREQMVGKSAQTDLQLSSNTCQLSANQVGKVDCVSLMVVW